MIFPIYSIFHVFIIHMYNIYIYTLFYGSPGPFHQFPLIKSDSCAPSQCEAGSSRCSDAREAAGAGNGPNLMKALVMNIMVN